MKNRHARRLLEQSVAELRAAREHLDFSFARTVDLRDDLQGAGDAQMESVEAYTSRFARAVDLLVNKVLRGLDEVEMEPPGTLLDAVLRAEKRGLVERADRLRELKAVRNAIVHDYAGTQLAEIFAYCRTHKAEFDQICDRTIAYARRLLT
ncbi:MAG: HepT-like ribonuclease domain-containing protein [Verrucomicrobiota bacterium]